MFNYIYLIQEREFIRLQEPVYKIGRTCQQDFKRFDGYPKNSHLVLMVDVIDCKAIETLIIKKFKRLFTHRKDYGNEYFEGEKMRMIKEILDIVQTFKPEPVKTKEEIELERERMKLEKQRLELEKEKVKLEREKKELAEKREGMEKKKREEKKDERRMKDEKREDQHCEKKIKEYKKRPKKH